MLTRRQLLAAGLTPHQVGHRLDRRRLHALYRGVYAVGHPLLPRAGHLLAAAWSAGPDGALCVVAAAAVHDLRQNDAARIDVVLPRRAPWRGQPGIRAHASSTLRPEDRTTVDGIPVTTIARTVIDLAATRPARLVERVLDEMVHLRVYDQRALDEQLARPFVRGARQLEAILATHAAGSTITKSDLEELLLALCDRFGLPRPRTNAWVARLEVDAYWAGTPVVVELDSVRFHTSRAAFERDREKGNALVAAGYTVLRVTWRQLTQAPEHVARTLLRALALPARQVPRPP